MREVEHAPRARDLAGELHGVTEAHRVLEAHLVEARVVGRGVPWRAALGEEHAAALGQHLAEDHARHHGVAGKVPLHEELVSRHVGMAHLPSKGAEWPGV